MARFFWKLSGLLLGLAFLAQLTLIPLAGKALNRGIPGLNAENMETEINSFPSWELLAGKIDRLSWRAEGVQLGELRVREVIGEFTRVRLSWWDLRLKKQLSFSFQEPGYILLLLTEDNLQDYFEKHQTAHFKDLKVQIEDEVINLTAFTSIVGRELTLAITGRLVLAGPDTIRFAPENVQIGGYVPSKEIQEELIGNASFQLPLGEIPLTLEMYELKTEKGKIRIKASAYGKIT